VLKGQTDYIDQPKSYLLNFLKRKIQQNNWFAKKKEGQIQELANRSAKNIKLF
jgi:hypothetical protein